MNLSEPFIRRPVATSLLAAGVTLLGAVAFKFLPTSRVPEFDYATFSVFAAQPGANPQTMASSIAGPLERRFGQIAGVTEMISNSSTGNALIAMQFDLTRDTNGAARDIEAAINAAGAELPRDLANRPYYRRENPSQTPFFLLALTSERYPISEVYSYALTAIVPRLSQIEGVSSAGLGGAAKAAIRVRANPGALASANLSFEDIRSLIRRSNADLPTGILDGDQASYLLKVNDRLLDPKGYRSLVVRNGGGSVVRLGDLARIDEGAENDQQAAWTGTKPAVVLHVQKEIGSNMTATADRINALVPQLQRRLPPGMKLAVVGDRTATIRLSVKHIEFTLLLSVILVILVVFLFLRKLSATAIPAFTIPVTLGATFALMYVMRFTVDNLTVMALAVAVGFIVDDAIVVIENTVRLVEAGEGPVEAALRGARQVGFTIVSMSASLVAVFIPVYFMGGVVGRLFREFVVTLAAAILISAAVSFTLTPMLCSRLLSADPVAASRRRFGQREWGFGCLSRLYQAALARVLRWRVAMLAMTAATMAGTIWLYIAIPKGFFPIEDNGFMLINVECSQDSSFAARSSKQQQVNAILLADPGIEGFDSVLRPGFPGVIYTQLKPLEVRKASIDKIIARLRPKMARIQGCSVFMRADQDLKIGARTGKTQYLYTLQGPDIDDLARASDKLLKELRTQRELRDVESDLQLNGLQAKITIDRNAAARMGVLPAAIDATLYDAFGQRMVSTIFTDRDQRHVVLEANPRLLRDPGSLGKIQVKSASGALVPLSAFSEVTFSNAVVTVNHQGQFPSVTLSFNLAPGISVSQATDAVSKVAARVRLPSSVQGSFQGTAKAFESSLAEQPFLIGAAVLVVYVVLGMLYESLVHPVTILSTIPSAGIGALIVLRAFHYELSIVAMIGIILLVGIVMRNAIILVDFALEVQRHEGLAAETAIVRACAVRFRPILMTAFVALFGALPLALQGGVGSELHKPLGVSIVGGLLLSQWLTLFSTPVVFVFMDRLQFRRRPSAEMAGAALGHRA